MSLGASALVELVTARAPPATDSMASKIFCFVLKSSGPASITH